MLLFNNRCHRCWAALCSCGFVHVTIRVLIVWSYIWYLGFSIWAIHLCTDHCVGNWILKVKRTAPGNLLNNWNLLLCLVIVPIFSSGLFVFGFNKMRRVLPTSSTRKAWDFHIFRLAKIKYALIQQVFTKTLHIIKGYLQWQGIETQWA